jgi:hypothetical protein
MPELEDLLKTPDFTSFKDWEPQNNSGDAIENRKGYADYVRGEYIKSNSYNRTVANEIDIATRDKAAEAGLIDPNNKEEVASLFTTKEPDLDTKLMMMADAMDTSDPEWAAANRYLTFKSVHQDLDNLAPDLIPSRDRYKQEAEEAAIKGFDTAKRIKVLNGELPLARVTNEDGEQEIIAGSMMDSMNLSEAIRSSKTGGVGFSDALNVQSLLSTPLGYKAPLYKVARYNEAAAMIGEIAKNDEQTAKVVDSFGTSLAWADENDREIFDAQKPDISAVRRSLNANLKSGHTFSDEEVDKALTQLAYHSANDQNKFKFYEDEDVGRNVRNVGYGTPLVSPALMLNKPLFDKALAAHPEITENQRTALNAQREIAAANSFDSYHKILTESTISSEWLNTLQSGRASGQKDSDTLEQFVSNPDNFGELTSRVGGVKESILDGFGELVAAVPMMMGADWARDYMVGNIKERQNRREVSRMFGREYGMGQDLAETIAPMIVDMAATTLLALATVPAAGTGGAAYLAAKQGARLTAKGLVKGLVSGALRQLPEETAEAAASRIAAAGLIKESVKEAGTKGSMAAINGFNSQLAKKVGVTSAMAIPAFNRSAGATYAGVYLQLENNKDITPEERHDRALGAGLAAGAITGLITGAFGAFGHGGLEDAMLKGATRSELKSVMARIANVSDIKDEVFNKVVAAEMKNVFKKYGSNLTKEVGKGFVDEGGEEGLDDFINGFITDAATDQNTPFLKRLEQAGYSALLGGFMGAGVPAIRVAAAPMFKQSSRERQLAVEVDFAKRVSSSLEASGSPLTAQAVYGILSAPRRTRAKAAEAQLKASRPTATAEAAPVEVVPTEAAPVEVVPAEAEAAAIEVAAKEVATEDVAKAEYKTPDDYDVMHELLTSDIASAGELTDRFGDVLKVTGYDPETREVTYTDEDGNEGATAITQLDLTNNQEAIAKQKPKMPTTIAEVEKISAALHANTSQESVASAIATDPDKAPDVGMDIDSIPNETAKKGRKTAARKGVSPVAAQMEQKEASLKEASAAPTGQLELQLSANGAPPVKVPRSRRSIKNQDKTADAEQLGLDPIQEAIMESSNHAGSVDENEAVVEAAVEDTVASVPIIAAGKKPTKASKKSTKVGTSFGQEVSEKPVAKVPETFDEETFIDDEFTGQEISTLQRLIGYGFPVRLQAKELHGYPKRASYDTGYLEGKSDLIAKKTAEMYKSIALSVQKNWTKVIGSRVTIFDTKLNKKTRTAPIGYVNDNGVGEFDNNPLTMKVLMENNHPVVIPEGFDLSKINPSFRYSKLGSEHILTDIVKVNPATGSGFVSTLTRQDTVLSEEPDYDFITKVSDFENLFNNKTAGEQIISNPLNQSEKITLRDALSTVTNIRTTAMEKLQDQGDRDAVRANAARLRLRRSRNESNDIIVGATKPFSGLLDTNFQETATIAFDMAYRRALRLHAMRLSFDKFSQRVSGEASPSLKPDRVNAAINEFIGLTKPEGSNQKVTIATRLQKTFGSDVNPETNPDLVIANFINNHILTAPTVPPTFRSVGQKVGNMYADQQRRRDLFARRALFQTTSPDKLSKISDLAYDPNQEVSIQHITPDKNLFSPASQFTKGLLQRTASDAIESIEADPELRTALDKLLRSTLYKGNSAFDISGMTSQDAFSQLASWMASGNHATNPEAIAFQRGLQDGDYENGMALRDALKIMHIASKSVTGSIDQDPDYIAELARNLSSSSGFTVTNRQAREFAKSIGQVATRLFSRSYVRGEQAQFARNLNDADVASLGLKNGDPQSVINAFKVIAATDTDPNKKLLARLLLENQPFIRQVAFSLDEVSLPYAGQFVVMADGTSAVSLNLNGHNGRGLSDALMHEYLHAFVNRVVSAPTELQTEDQRSAIQRLNGILNLVRDTAANNGIDSPMLTDGLVNLNEFIAHFFTSTDFQNLVKTLTPPAKQRGFFARVVDAILDVFGMGKSRQSAYQQAFTDVIDLTRSAIHSAPNAPSGLINKLAVKSSELLANAKSVGTAFGAVTGDGTVLNNEYAAAEAEEAAAKTDEDVQVSDLMLDVDPASIAFDPTTDTNKTMIETMKRSMLLVRRLVPKEIALRWNIDIPMAEVDLQTGVMSMNPQSVAALIIGKTPAQAGLAIKTMVDEEMRHVASFNSLTESEIAAIVDAKKDSDFEEIANEYYGNEANRALALERLRSEDPDVSGSEKVRLVEERLRMLAQKVQRNTTTEQDYAFWRTNPSTLKILGRYLKNMINLMFGNHININNKVASFVRGKSVLAMSADEMLAVQRIVTEMRALQSGYRLSPNSMSFDPENPSDVVGMFSNQVGTSFGDLAAQLSEAPFPMSSLLLLHGAQKAAEKATNKVVANQLAEMAIKFWGGIVTSNSITPEQMAIITDNCTREVVAALNASGRNAADWYSTAIEVAMSVAAVIHPELSDVNAARAVPAFASAADPVQAANFAMRMALAITSQNINVEQNTQYAEEQFTLLKRDGQFDPTISYGSKAAAIKSNLNLANILVAKYGYGEGEMFVRKEFTVKQLTVIASEIRGKKVTVSGANDDKVNGAAIFGPKIGQGFLQNLLSVYDPVTVDLWMRRTWGRWTGDVVGDGVTETRLTNLILGAKEANIPLPKKLSDIAFVPALNVKGKPFIEKDGSTRLTVEPAAVARLSTDKKFKELCEDTALKLNAEWERQYKLLALPISQKLSDDLLSGKISLNQYVKLTDKLIEKSNAEYAALSASGNLPPTTRKDWIAKKTKQVTAEAKKQKLTDAERKVLLSDLPNKFDALAAKDKTPRITVELWRLQKFAKAGRDMVLTKDQMKEVKPSWANAASVIKSKLNPIDAPSDQDRRVITKIVNNSRLQLKALGYDTTNADIQAILWYPEKDLWAKLTGNEESNLKLSYDEEFINIATQRGFGDEARTIAESIRTNRTPRNSGGDDELATGDATGQTNVSVGTSFGLWDSPLQDITSADTSINDKKTAATFSKVKFAEGTINADIGGGRFDNATDVLKAQGATNIIFDPFNRSSEYNTAAAAQIKDGQSDTTTVNNVLNVIQEATNRDKVIRQAANAVKPNGISYFLLYEGDRSGVGRKTSKGWQENRKTKDYINEIKAHYGNVIVKNGIIEATNPINGRSVVGTSFGDVSQLPARFDADKMDFSNFVQALEMPMLEVGTYRSPKTILDRLFRGELDPRITTLKNHRDFFKSAAANLVKNYKTKLDGIIEKDFGSLENAPLDDIAAAIGSTRGTILDKAIVDQIEDTYQAALETIDIDTTLNARQKTAARKIAIDDKAQAIDAERTAQADAIRAARDAALESLAKQSPDLARHIVQLRTLTDEVSNRVTSLYGFKPELAATFDSQLGIYLTRSYKMFHEVGFAETVRSDPSYEPQRQAAMDFFGKQFVEYETARRVKAGETQSDAENNARIDLANKAANGRSIAENALEEFISHYEKKGISTLAGSSMSESFRILLKNIKQKKDIPEELRGILGEYGSESGVDNLLRSFVTVSSMAANQSFLQHVKTIGVTGGWLMTRAELDAKLTTDYDAYKNYTTIRHAKDASAYDPLGDLFGPPELVEGLNKVFSSESRNQNMDTAQESVAKTLSLFAKLTGGAMAAKTLGSLGFYIRNIASNILFFGPSQGFYNFGSMLGTARKEIGSSLADPNQIDEYHSELISLGVIGNEIKATVMADLLRGTTTIQSVESQLDKLIKAAHSGTKPLTWLTEKAQLLAQSADAFYKIAYYENELKVLESARAAGGGRFGTMSDYELKREAASKVLMTAQSASQAPPIVKEISKSGIGLLFSPFLRFKAEVPRIVLNTYKLAIDEMRSGNSVIKARGQKRFRGMTFVVGGVSMIVPAVLRAITGIGDDEDEALRASLPSYLRNHTFFYRRDGDGKLQSWDFTFLNPFSLISDPAMRSLEHLLRGDPAKAAASLVETAIFDQYLDDQIFSSAIQSLRDNRDPATDKPIYEPKIDSTGTILVKSMAHVFRQAYMPSVMNRAIKAYQAVGADYTDFDSSPIGILLQEVYPVKRHDIELDKQLRRYLSESRDVYNRINERKNVLFSERPIDEASIREIITSEVEDKAAMNEEIYRKLRGYEGLGLPTQEIYSIMTGKNMGYGKDRSRLLFNKMMDRPVLTPDFQARLADPTNEQGMERMRIANDELKKYSRYILIEP